MCFNFTWCNEFVINLAVIVHGTFGEIVNMAIFGKSDFCLSWLCHKLMEMGELWFRTTKNSIWMVYYIVIIHLLHSNNISPLCCAQRHIILLFLLNCGWKSETVCWTDDIPWVCECWLAEKNPEIRSFPLINQQNALVGKQTNKNDSVSVYM